MNILTKSVLGAGAAAAALVAVAVPAQAGYDRRDNISAGEVIAGAVVLGGLAAILLSNDDNRDRRYQGDYRRGGDDNYDYGRGGYDDRGSRYSNQGNGRHAVNKCVRAAEAWGNRYSRVKVTEIRDIDRTRYGYKITGNLVLKDGWRGRGHGYGRDRYDRYDDNGRYGYGGGYDRGYDRGRFACYVENGRVVDVKYSGLDNWR